MPEDSSFPKSFEVYVYKSIVDILPKTFSILKILNLKKHMFANMLEGSPADVLEVRFCVFHIDSLPKIIEPYKGLFGKRSRIFIATISNRLEITLFRIESKKTTYHGWDSILPISRFKLDV